MYGNVEFKNNSQFIMLNERHNKLTLAVVISSDDPATQRLQEDSNSNAGACKKCGYHGHLSFQCRNFVKINSQQDVVLDVSSTSSEPSDDETPLKTLEKRLKKKVKKKKKKHKEHDRKSHRHSGRKRRHSSDEDYSSPKKKKRKKKHKTKKRHKHSSDTSS